MKIRQICYWIPNGRKTDFYLSLYGEYGLWSPIIYAFCHYVTLVVAAPVKDQAIRRGFFRSGDNV